jgi:hypothetical protein
MSAGVERKRKAAALAQAGLQQHRAAGELFGITELCAEFGITLRTIRFYEDKGLLTPRRVNGARVYTRATARGWR